MAEQKQEKADNVGKTFEGIKFEKVEDSFTVNVQYNAEAELLTMKLVNEKSKNVFKQIFDTDAIHKITDQCKLAPDLVVKMIIDNLGSAELLSKNIRIYYLPNIQQGIIMCTLLSLKHSQQYNVKHVHSNKEI